MRIKELPINVLSKGLSNPLWYGLCYIALWYVPESIVNYTFTRLNGRVVVLITYKYHVIASGNINQMKEIGE